jgi:hypothetical protein
MSAAIRAIRTVAPDLALTGRELADTIASCAIQYGHAIDVDVEGNVTLPATLASKCGMLEAPAAERSWGFCGLVYCNCNVIEIASVKLYKAGEPP